MPIEPKKPLSSRDRKRLIIIALFIFSLFSLLVAQFYKIQIIEGDKWTRYANGQHFFFVNEPFHRGTFISNATIKRGHPETPQSLVVDIQRFHLYIDPQSIPEEERGAISDKLMGMLELTIDEAAAFRQQFDKRSRSRKLAMWLEKEDRDAVLEWWTPYARVRGIPRNALFFTADYQRSYPFGKLLGQVLHTIRNTKEELTQQAVPTGGLELQFNSYLRGKQGKRRLMRSPRNSLEMGEVIAYPEHGADIYLTINHYLQAIAEDEIAKGVKKCKAKCGWAVMMDPYTGEILALAQYPFFYPPDYQAHFNDPKLTEHTRVKAITDANEPGSVVKPFTIAAALLANEELQKKGEPPLFDPDEKVATSNGRFPGRSRPLNDTSFHPFMNMEIAMQKSANIYMARLTEKIVNRLGNGWYRQVMHDTFGFGVKTGIELPAETPGVMPTIGKKHANGAQEWSTPTPFSLAIGYNLQLNSVQLLRAYAILANGGYRVQPTLIRKVVKTHPDGTQEVLLDNTSPERVKTFPKVLSDSIVKKVVTAMKYVTKPGGTARRADILGYTEAGKTSTSKKIINGAYSDTAYCSQFIGFAPAKNPAFVLVVVMDEPEYGYMQGVGKTHHGGTCAAPVFREIGKRSLEYMGVPPDDPHGYPPGDPRYDPAKADWAVETRRLQEIYEKWNNK